MKNTIYSLFGNISFAILGFASIAILSRTLSVSNFGVWVIYLTAVSLFDMFRIGFIQTGLVKFLSGQQNENAKSIIGSSWIIGLVTTLIISLILFVCSFFIEENTPFYFFFKYYPLLSLTTLPQLFVIAILQAKLEIKKQMTMKLIIMLSNLLLFGLTFFFPFEVKEFLFYHIIVNAAISLILILIKKSYLDLVFHTKKTTIVALLNFGKFSLGTLIFTNLLKSSDTFLIALYLGPDKAALYSIPLKLTETFEIFLRSVLNVSIPSLSSFANNNNIISFKNEFCKQSGSLLIIYIPFMVFCFLFSETLITLLGGQSYWESVIIFQVFTIYGLILPLDRFTGVGLDCLNMPKKNLVKVAFMVGLNLILDLIILNVNGSLVFVAIGTCCTTLLGTILGLFFINRSFSLRLKEIYKSGFINLISLIKIKSHARL